MTSILIESTWTSIYSRWNEMRLVLWLFSKEWLMIGRSLDSTGPLGELYMENQSFSAISTTTLSKEQLAIQLNTIGFMPTIRWSKIKNTDLCIKFLDIPWNSIPKVETIISKSKSSCYPLMESLIIILQSWLPNFNCPWAEILHIYGNNWKLAILYNWL